MKRKIRLSDKELYKPNFYKQLVKSRLRNTKVFNPRVSYTKDYDIFAINWSDKPVKSTIELNLIGEGDLRFDLSREGTIIGIEIEDLQKVLRVFNCDEKKKKAKM
jgi:uncharacterized protein YuzE